MIVDEYPNQTDPKSLEERVRAAVEIFDLPYGAAQGYVDGRQSDLDHEVLCFGQKYRVMQAIASNRGGAVHVGQVLRFVGVDRPTETETLLYFEGRGGAKVALHFDQNAPQTPDKRRYLRDVEAHFRPVMLDFSKRKKRLLAARVVLSHLRDAEDVPKDTETATEPAISTKARKPTGWDAENDVIRRPLPHVTTRLEAANVPSSLEDVARGGLGTSLDHGVLQFGHVYKVINGLKANRLGALTQGGEVRFLGSYYFPYDNGLRVHLEMASEPGTHFALEFEGNFPEAEGVVRMLSDVNVGQFLTQAPADPLPARKQELDQAAELLVQVSEETEVLKDAAYEAALPSYEKALLELIDVRRLASPVAYKYVMGDADSEIATLDHETLTFGAAYKVIAPVFGNRSGNIAVGEVVYFRGATTRYGEEVTLWFEGQDNPYLDIVFYPTNEAAAEFCGPLNEPAAYFEMLKGSKLSRNIELSDARQILDDLRAQREASL